VHCQALPNELTDILAFPQRFVQSWVAICLPAQGSRLQDSLLRSSPAPSGRASPPSPALDLRVMGPTLPPNAGEARSQQEQHHHRPWAPSMATSAQGMVPLPPAHWQQPFGRGSWVMAAALLDLLSVPRQGCHRCTSAGSNPSLTPLPNAGEEPRREDGDPRALPPRWPSTTAGGAGQTQPHRAHLQPSKVFCPAEPSIKWLWAWKEERCSEDTR